MPAYKKKSNISLDGYKGETCLSIYKVGNKENMQD